MAAASWRRNFWDAVSPVVLVVLDLHEVVQKADDAEDQGEQEDEQGAEPSLGKVLPAGDQDGDENSRR